MSHLEIASPHTRLAWLVVLPLAIGVGVLVPLYPLAAAGLVALLLALTLIGLRAVRGIFLATLFIVLVGYMFLGRGFAYVGVEPIYVGEVALALGVLALLVSGPVRRIGAVQWLILAFMAWGAIRTIPYVGEYGIDALRDGVIWIYASFAIMLSLVMIPVDARRLMQGYGRVAPLFALLLPVIGAIWFIGRDTLIPSIPGTDVQALYFKAGDMGVHLAGVAAFFLAGFALEPGARRLMQPLVWAAWLVGAVIVASYSRAAMLASGMAVVVLPFRRHLDRWMTPFLIGILVIGLIGAFGVEFDIGRRSISIDQLTSNLASVFGDSSNPELTGTREWREEWWSKIIGYTIEGPDFWDGRGYGINLALVDGFLGDDPGLRAPHSAHFDILARSGVIGLGLWVALLAAFAATLVRAALVARRNHLEMWVAMIAWMLAYWAAAVLDMSFDVYLEGPQGGILFWSLTGAGLAIAAMVHELTTPDAAGGRPPVPGGLAIVTEAFGEPVLGEERRIRLANDLQAGADDERDL